MKTKSPLILLTLLVLLAQFVISAATPAVATPLEQQPQINTIVQNNPKLHSLVVDLGMSAPSVNAPRVFLPFVAGSAQSDVSTAGNKPSLWPEARGYHRMVYSAATKRVLLVGGEDHSGWNDNLPGYGGLWSFDADQQNWQKLQDSLPLVVDWVTYDEEHDQIIAYVSFHAPTTPDGFPEPVSETWAYDVKTNRWENRNPSTHPPIGLLGGGAQMTYDRDAEKVIMFGGLDLLVLKEFFDTGDLALLEQLETNNTWVYDYASNQWNNRMPANPPTARNSHALVYDPATERTILFGGGDAFVSFDDTWAYDYASNRWSELKPLNHPSTRAYGYMAVDERSYKIVYFGGVDYTETIVYADTWLYDAEENRWTEQHPTSTPSPHGWYDIVYSPKAKGVMLFGGGKDRFSFTDEAWIYQVKTNRWMQIPKP